MADAEENLPNFTKPPNFHEEKLHPTAKSGYCIRTKLSKHDSLSEDLMTAFKLKSHHEF